MRMHSWREEELQHSEIGSWIIEQLEFLVKYRRGLVPFDRYGIDIEAELSHAFMPLATWPSEESTLEEFRAWRAQFDEIVEQKIAETEAAMIARGDL